MFRKSKKMHFVGIGGIGMSGIAEILMNLGYSVSGSDLSESARTKKLREKGAAVYIGHSPENIRDYNVVVTSSAIDRNNIEIVEAYRRKIPVIHRSEMLAELVRLKHGIGVAGTHGKTTTSSLLSYLLYEGGLNPTAVIGGEVRNFGSNARVGQGEYIVFEADESDGSFLKLLPTIAIVTNIDADHLDHYKFFNNIKLAFLEYINNIPFYGYSVLCADDSTIREILPLVERPYLTYGFSPDAMFRASDVVFDGGFTEFRCEYEGRFCENFKMAQFGAHNVLNALACIAVAHDLGMGIKTIREGLLSFQGVGRRLEKIYEDADILLLDDYGHHPTEIRATLEAVKRMGRRLTVLFQPHRYTRTQFLWDEFGQSFGRADRLILTDIYPAGEQPIEGVSSELLRESVEKHEGIEVRVISDFEKLADTVINELQSGDLVLTLGAGNINRVAAMIAEKLRKKNAEN